MKAKLLYLITEDWFFCSHFLARAVAARAAGYEVLVVARERQHGELIRQAGLRLIPVEFSRKRLHPLKELGLLREILRIYRQERPDVVHQIAVKPILYGTLAARLAGLRNIVNAPVGMGYVFSSDEWRARCLRPALRLAYRFLMNPSGSRVIFENRDDLAAFVEQGTVRRGDAALIRGAGVDVSRFHPVAVTPENGLPVVMLVARMLRDKGVLEFVAAARRLHEAGLRARFVLVGDPDVENPATIDEPTLHGWHGQFGVEWWGRREDMPEVFAQADVVCLPSYREGLPKVLLEAAACGRALVATDVPGCREIVIDGYNGLLVPARDSQALAAAIERLLQDAGLRQRFGACGRALVEAEFAEERVVEQTLALYAASLSARAGE